VEEVGRIVAPGLTMEQGLNARVCCADPLLQTQTRPAGSGVECEGATEGDRHQPAGSPAGPGFAGRPDGIAARATPRLQRALPLGLVEHRVPVVSYSRIAHVAHDEYVTSIH